MRSKIVFVLAITLGLFLTGHGVLAELDRKNELPQIKNNINPHNTGRFCEECHTGRPEKGSELSLKFNGDFNQLCSCHNYNNKNYSHPVGLRPSDEKKVKIPAGFPLENGKLSCGTCHDVSLQCQYSRFKTQNKKFLRGWPYKKRTDICFRCHDEKKYEKLDPHKQLNADGEIITKNCLYCHEEKPDEKTSTFENVKLVGDLKMVCQRCHNIEHKHPSGKEHFRIPKEQMLITMKSAEIIFSTILPLDHEGRITCVTCHNPHEKGVIPDEREGAKGAGEQNKNRLAGIMCDACHNL